MQKNDLTNDLNSQKEGDDRIAEKGKGTWCRKGERKTRRRGRGRSRRNTWRQPLPVQHCPKGSSPQGKSEAITKSELHSPLGSSET